MLKFSTVFALALVGTFGANTSISEAQPVNTGDPSQALSAFLNWHFLDDNSTAAYKLAVQDLVGQYIIVSNGVPTVTGDTLVDPKANVLIQIKDDETYKAQFEQKVDVGFNLLKFVGIQASNDKLYQMIVSDEAEVTNTAVKGADCAAHRPSEIDAKTQYWCIAAVTLSKISYTQYDKGTATGNGAVNIATASGSYSLDDEHSGYVTKISYLAFGPYVNGVLQQPGSGAKLQFYDVPLFKAPPGLPKAEVRNIDLRMPTAFKKPAKALPLKSVHLKAKPRA